MSMKPYAIQWHDVVAKHRTKDTEAEARADAVELSKKTGVAVIVLGFERQADGSRSAHPIARYVDGADSGEKLPSFEPFSKKRLAPHPEYAAPQEGDAIDPTRDRWPHKHPMTTPDPPARS